MAYEEVLVSISLKADDTLAVYTGAPGVPGAPESNAGNIYRFVKVTDVNTCGLATDDADLVVGVCQNKPQVEGQAATVAISGVTNVVAGAAVDAGSQVVSDTEGRAIEGAGGPGGIALTSAAAAGELVSVLLRLG